MSDRIVRRCARLLLLAALLASAACADRAPAELEPIELALLDEREDQARGPLRDAYRPRASDRWGGVAGTIALRGESLRDTMVNIHDEPQLCGERVTVPLVRGERDRVADVVVWIDGIREGKPLPFERRFELLYSRCRLEPRTQSAVVGGMLQIRSADPIEHRTRMIRAATGEILGVVRQGDAGSLVPLPEALASPGLLEFRSEPRPWARAFVRVFDHPYHTVTPVTGAFAFDSVPPGRRRIIAWHPRFGRLATDVQIVAGEIVEVELTFDGDGAVAGR